MKDRQRYIAETVHGTYFYHLHDTDDPKFGGGQLTALCGKTFSGWDTKIPVSTWGKRTHLHESYCFECTRAASGKG